MHVFVEVVHLESIELVGDSLDVGLFIWLFDLYAWSIPGKYVSILMDSVDKCS